jgi:hypothetical protein
MSVQLDRSGVAAPDSTTSFTLECAACPGMVLAAGELTVSIEPQGDHADNEKWNVVTVFDPLRKLSGVAFVNVGTGGVLQFVAANRPLSMGSLSNPIDPSQVWSPMPVEGGPYWQFTSARDERQAIDKYGYDACRPGAVIQSWGCNGSACQQWQLGVTS